MNAVLYGVTTIACGILAASAYIVARRPDARQLIDKLTPYQGWIGFVLFFWGAWLVFGLVTQLSFERLKRTEDLLYGSGEISDTYTV
jgi:hypothetical protein